MEKNHELHLYKIYYMAKQNLELTSVKLPIPLFEQFKIACVLNKFSLQKLTERSMYLYLTDETFRTNLHNTLHTQLTGSI